MSDALLTSACCGDLSSIAQLLSVVESSNVISSDRSMRILSVAKVHLSPCKDKILYFPSPPTHEPGHDHEIVLSSLKLLCALIDKNDVCSGYAMSLCISVWEWFPFLLSTYRSPLCRLEAAKPTAEKTQAYRIAILDTLLQLFVVASLYSKEQTLSQPSSLHVFLDLWLLEMQEWNNQPECGALSRILVTAHTYFGPQFISEVATRSNMARPFLRRLSSIAEDWSPLDPPPHPAVTYFQILYDIQALAPDFHRDLVLRGAVSAILLAIRALLPLDKDKFTLFLPHLRRNALSSIAYFHQIWLCLIYLGNTLGSNPKERDVLTIFVFKEVLLTVIERLFISDHFAFFPKLQLQMVEDACARIFNTIASFLVFPKILEHATRFVAAASKVQWEPLQTFSARVYGRTTLMTPVLRAMSPTPASGEEASGLPTFSNAYPMDYRTPKFIQRLVQHDYFSRSALINQLKLEYKSTHLECVPLSLVTILDYTDDSAPLRVVELDEATKKFTTLDVETLRCVKIRALEGKGELVLWRVGQLEDCQDSSLELLTSREEHRWKESVHSFAYSQISL